MAEGAYRDHQHDGIIEDIGADVERQVSVVGEAGELPRGKHLGVRGRQAGGVEQLHEIGLA